LIKVLTFGVASSSVNLLASEATLNWGRGSCLRL